jgi:hypothetical protein
MPDPLLASSGCIPFQFSRSKFNASVSASAKVPTAGSSLAAKAACFMRVCCCSLPSDQPILSPCLFITPAPTSATHLLPSRTLCRFFFLIAKASSAFACNFLRRTNYGLARACFIAGGCPYRAETRLTNAEPVAFISKGRPAAFQASPRYFYRTGR